MGCLATIPPRDCFLNPVPDGRGSYEQGSRSTLVYRLKLFQLKCIINFGTWTQQCPGNVTVFYHNDGMLFNIMGVRVILVYFGIWTVLS